MSGRTVAPTQRRAQADRREATRQALLDAAIECLVEEGYAALTTRKVAARAGVSQGAQQHYFPGRVDLVVQAVGHLAERLVAEAHEQVRTRHRDERRRVEALLDRSWELHCGPVFRAAAELWAVAHSDADLRGPIEDLGRALDRQFAELIAEMLPALARDEVGRTLFDIAFATTRGLALRRLPGLELTVDRRWHAARALLLSTYDGLTGTDAVA
ncbi:MULTISPECIES: TetR/AcrR family transcriptional regulator [unclassified Mycobacteroides]|uniref:TetR/AcrR family transcriptional regulator n=1 Tax=unclassified Mycobacteroides TaxID=2618759 RepID=UPI001396965D|nr:MULTISPECIES: TetR/AcrR family transcriptional regulator [unclassified Mycobacteroides]